MKALRRIQTTSSSSNPSSPLTSPRSPSSSSWIHLRSALFVVASSSPSSSSSDRSVFLLKLDLKILSLTSRTFQMNKSLLAFESDNSMLLNLGFNVFRARLKSPWSHKKRKRPLRAKQWKRFFTSEGRLRNGGVDLLRKVRRRVSHGPTPFPQPFVLSFKHLFSSLPL